MTKTSAKTLRFIWRIIPWLVVGLMVAFIFEMGGRIQVAKARLEESKKEALSTETPPVRVILLDLKPQTLVDKMDLPGDFEAGDDLMVRAEVGGRVVEVLVDEGQKVNKGQILVKIDDRDYRNRLTEIQANHHLAKVEYERIATLAKKKVTSASKLDNMEAQMNSLAAQVEVVKLALERTQIRAPISGRVNEIKSELGVFLSTGDPVAQIIKLDPIKITVGVPESDVAACIDLKEADVVIDALDGLRIRGKKVFLSHQPRTFARLFDLEMETPNPDGRILAGMFARVELVRKVHENALAVPLYSVISQNGDMIVYVEKDGLAEKRIVTLGALSGWQVQVTSGLEPGDKVVIVGHRFLDDQQPVEIIKTVDDPSEVLKS